MATLIGEPKTIRLEGYTSVEIWLLKTASQIQKIYISPLEIGTQVLLLLKSTKT